MYPLYKIHDDESRGIRYVHNVCRLFIDRNALRHQCRRKGLTYQVRSISSHHWQSMTLMACVRSLATYVTTRLCYTLKLSKQCATSFRAQQIPPHETTPLNHCSSYDKGARRIPPGLSASAAARPCQASLKISHPPSWDRAILHCFVHHGITLTHLLPNHLILSDRHSKSRNRN